MRQSARALGIATQADLRDYFRLPVDLCRASVARLVEAGALLPADVEGWGRPAYLAADAEAPARLSPTALVAPFDSLVWQRERTARLFGFHYRLEFYTPAERRRYGYYVMPFLMNGRLVGRVDLKADRAASVLRVEAAFHEEAERPHRIAPALAAELALLAEWLGLAGIRSAGRGPLADALTDALNL